MDSTRSAISTFIKLTTCLIAFATLSACGGGDSESSDTYTEPDQQTVTIQTTEASVETRQLNGKIDAESVTPISGFDSPFITTQTTDDTLSVTVANLPNEASERFTVKTDMNIVYTVVINAQNSSAQPAVRHAETLAEITSPQALARDDLRLLNTVLEIKYLATDISESEKAAASAEAAAAVASLSTTVANEVTLLNQVLANYQAGDATETDLKQQLSAATAALRALDDAGENALDSVTDTLGAMGITLPTDLQATSPLTFVDQANRYSRFMNSDYGRFDENGNFSFSPQYDFFNAVFPYASSQ